MNRNRDNNPLISSSSFHKKLDDNSIRRQAPRKHATSIKHRNPLVIKWASGKDSSPGGNSFKTKEIISSGPVNPPSSSLAYTNGVKLETSESPRENKVVWVPEDVSSQVTYYKPYGVQEKTILTSLGDLKSIHFQNYVDNIQKTSPPKSLPNKTDLLSSYDEKSRQCGDYGPANDHCSTLSRKKELLEALKTLKNVLPGQVFENVLNQTGNMLISDGTQGKPRQVDELKSCDIKLDTADTSVTNSVQPERFSTKNLIALFSNKNEDDHERKKGKDKISPDQDKLHAASKPRFEDTNFYVNMGSKVLPSEISSRYFPVRNSQCFLPPREKSNERSLQSPYEKSQFKETVFFSPEERYRLSEGKFYSPTERYLIAERRLLVPNEMPQSQERVFQSPNDFISQSHESIFQSLDERSQSHELIFRLPISRSQSLERSESPGKSPPSADVVNPCPERRSSSSGGRYQILNERQLPPFEKAESPHRRSHSPGKKSASPRRRSPHRRKRSLSPGKKRRSNSRKSQSPHKKGKRHRSPHRRSRSPGKRHRSPRRRSRSPDKRHRSPPRRSRSPPKKHRSPRRRSQSSDKRHRSPSRRSRSPNKRHRSARRRSRSPNKRHRSPHRSSRSPLKKHRSPRRRSKSPCKKYQSPHRRSRSPLSGPRSPAIRPQSPCQESQRDSPSLKNTIPVSTDQSSDQENRSVEACHQNYLEFLPSELNSFNSDSFPYHAYVMYKNELMPLSKNHYFYVEKNLLRKIQLSSLENPEIAFKACYWNNFGWVSVICSNEITVNWLMQQEISPSTKEFRIMLVRDFYSTHTKIALNVSHSMYTFTEILENLGALYLGLKVNSWRVFKMRHTKSGRRITAIIPHESAKFIQEREWILYLTSNEVEVERLELCFNDKEVYERHSGSSQKRFNGPLPAEEEKIEKNEKLKEKASKNDKNMNLKIVSTASLDALPHEVSPSEDIPNAIGALASYDIIPNIKSEVPSSPSEPDIQDDSETDVQDMIQVKSEVSTTPKEQDFLDDLETDIQDVIQGSSLERFEVAAFFPKSQIFGTIEDALTCFHDQNPELHVPSWKILKQRKYTEGTRIYFSIDAASRNALDDLEWRPFYELTRIIFEPLEQRS